MQEVCLAILVVLVVVGCALPTDYDKLFPWVNSGGIEGDMMLQPGQKLGVVNPRLLWPEKTLYYTLDPSYGPSELRYIQAAIDEIQQLRCVQIKKRTTQSNYVEIVNDDKMGCKSWIGMIGGPQMLSLSKAFCFHPESAKGVVIHELLHAFGVFHEHNHPDRDNYVKILEENIAPYREVDFEKLDRTQATDFNVGYDYGSLMHYPWNGAAANPNLRTIQPTKDPNAIIGQCKGLSSKDIQKLKIMYKC